MFRCPYCGTQMPHPEPEHVPMSFKRRAIFDCIKGAGPVGISVGLLIEKFFPTAKDATVRTTIHNINSVIRPMRIVRRGGIVRLVPKD